MQISIKYGYVFLSMPKCASTSVEHEISQYSDGSFTGHPALKHINARRYKKHIEPLFLNKIRRKNIDVVCLVREPIEWLYSWYRYRTREELANPKHPNHHNYTGEVSFNEFVNYCMSDSKPAFARIGTQSYFIENDSGEMLATRLFKLESLSNLERYFSRKIGNPVSFPKKNVSPLSSLSLDEETHKRLLGYLEKDYYYYRQVAR